MLDQSTFDCPKQIKRQLGDALKPTPVKGKGTGDLDIRVTTYLSVGYV